MGAATVRVLKRSEIPPPNELTTKNNQLMSWTFVVMGVTILASWGGLMNIMHDLETFVFPGHVIRDTVLAVTMTAVAVVNTFWVLYDKISIALLYAAAAGITICTILVPIVILTMQGTEGGIIALHVVGFGLGTFQGTMYPFLFGLAAVMPHDKSPTAGVGVGLAGTYSLILYAIITVFAVEITTYDDLPVPMCIFWTFLAAPGFIGVFLLYTLLRQPWCYGNVEANVRKELGLPDVIEDVSLTDRKDMELSTCRGTAARSCDKMPTPIDELALAKPSSKNDKGASTKCGSDPFVASNELSATAEAIELAKIKKWEALSGFQKLKLMIGDTWMSLFATFWTFFCTLQVYPNVGPLGWGDSRTHTLFLIGVHQISELLTRFAFDQSGWTIKVKIGGRGKTQGETAGSSETDSDGYRTVRPLAFCGVHTALIMFTITMLKTGLVPIYVLIQQFNKIAVLGDLWLHYVMCLIGGVALGWSAQACVYWCPYLLKKDRPERVKILASKMCVMCIQYGVLSGVWLSKAYI